ERRHEPKDRDRPRPYPKHRLSNADQHIAGASTHDFGDGPHHADARAVGGKSEYHRKQDCENKDRHVASCVARPPAPREWNRRHVTLYDGSAERFTTVVVQETVV